MTQHDKLGHHTTHTPIVAPDPFSPADINAHRLALHMAYAEARTGAGHNIEAPPSRPVRDFVLNFLALLAALTVIPLGMALLLKSILQ